MIALAIYGYCEGQVGQMMAPVSGDGQMCGYSPGVEDYPDLYIADIQWSSLHTSDLFKPAVCVKKCPKENGDTIECVNTKWYTDKNANCATYDDIYGSSEAFGYCLPIEDKLTPLQQKNWDKMEAAFEDSFLGGWATDCYKARWVILTCAGISIAIALIYIYIMDWCAFWIAWISVVLI